MYEEYICSGCNCPSETCMCDEYEDNFEDESFNNSNHDYTDTCHNCRHFISSSYQLEGVWLPSCLQGNDNVVNICDESKCAHFEK